MLKVFLALLLSSVGLFAAAGGGGVTANLTFVNRGGSLFGAKQVTPAGSTIYVSPGVHTNGMTNLFKGGVDWFFLNSRLQLYDNPQNTTGAGIFDDRFSGAVTCNVSGSLSIEWCSGTNVSVNPLDCSLGYNTNAIGPIVVTQALSLIRWDAPTKIQAVGVNSGSAYSLWVQNCQTGTVFRTLESSQLWYPSNKVIITTSCPADPGTTYDTDLYSSFFFWAKGTCDVEFTTAVHRQYGMQCYSATSSDTDELRIRGNLLDGKIYVVGKGPEWKIWADILELKRSSDDPNTGGIEIYYTGKYYFRHQKVSSRGVGGGGAVITLTHPGVSGTANTNLLVWVNIDKLSGSNRWINVTHGTLRGRIGEFEQNGPTIENWMINVTNATARLLLSGETMPSERTALNHSGGRTELWGYTINSTNRDPIFVNGSGLHLNSTTLIPGLLATNAIRANSAQNVSLYGSVWAKSNAHANVTAIVGTLNVDSDVD